MKINLNTLDKNKLDKLLEQKEINISITDMINDFCYEQNYIKKVNSNIDYLNKIKEYFEIEDELDNKYFDKALKDNIKEIDPKILLDNEYYKNIKLDNIKYKNYKIVNETYKAYQAFPYDDVSIDIKNNYLEKLKIGYFTKDTNFPAIEDNKGNIWMSITPNEILTSNNFFDELQGNIIIFGLGLGYYLYKALNIDKVTSITVIEKDKEIIEIFDKYLKPQFKNMDKVKIINDDALNIINNILDYDFALIDLWHNGIDGLPLYLKFKQKENNFKNCKLYYWLEESIKTILRRCALVLIEESLENKDDKYYLNNENDIDKIINDLYFKTKNLEINSYQEILDFIDINNLIKIINI